MALKALLELRVQLREQAPLGGLLFVALERQALLAAHALAFDREMVRGGDGGHQQCKVCERTQA